MKTDKLSIDKHLIIIFCSGEIVSFLEVRLYAPWTPNIVGDRSVFRVFSLSLPTKLEHDLEIFDLNL